MKVRSYAPALAAVIALGGLYLFVTRRHDDATPPAPAAARAVEQAAVPSAPTPAARPEMPAPTVVAAPEQAPPPPPKPMDPAEAAAHEAKAKKPKLTLDETLAETTKHIAVMEKRAELIDQEVAELTKAGKTKEAAEQRIVAERLRKHVERLRADVAAHRDPNEDAFGDDSRKAKDEHAP